MFEENELVLRNDGKIVRLKKINISFTNRVGKLCFIYWEDDRGVMYNEVGSWDDPFASLIWTVTKLTSLEREIYV